MSADQQPCPSCGEPIWRDESVSVTSGQLGLDPAEQTEECPGRHAPAGAKGCGARIRRHEILRGEWSPWELRPEP